MPQGSPSARDCTPPDGGEERFHHVEHAGRHEDADTAVALSESVEHSHDRSESPYSDSVTADSLLWLNAIAFVPLALVGTLLHFGYDWSGHKRFVAVFAAVNESYWEHIKIAFWPLLLWFGVQFAIGGWMIPGFVPAATAALYSVPVTMIAIVFGYKSLTGRNVLWIDILAFFLTIALSLAVFVLLAVEVAASSWTIALSVFFLTLLGIAFARFTHTPPDEPDLFIDPLNAKYGIDAHPED